MSHDMEPVQLVSFSVSVFLLLCDRYKPSCLSQVRAIQSKGNPAYYFLGHLSSYKDLPSF